MKPVTTTLEAVDPRQANLTPLSEYAVKRRGSVDPKKFPKENFELFSIPAYEVGKPEEVLGAEIGSAKKVVEPGDVLISRIVPHIQRVWVVPEANGKRQIASGEWIVFKDARVAPEFLRHMLLAKPFHEQFMQTVAGMGGSLLRARPQEVERIEILVPSDLDEQRRIAAILNKADAIRRKREQALNLADDLLKSTFLEMFGNPATNTRGWKEGVIGDCLTGVVGGWSAKGDSRAAKVAEMGVLKISAVTSGEYVPEENKVVADLPEGRKIVIPKEGDLLFSRANTRELVAATCIVSEAPTNVFLPDKLWRLDADADIAEVIYLKFVLTHPEYRETLCYRATGTSGSMLNISKTKLLSHPIPLPDLELQRDFSKLWRSVQATIRKSRAALSGCEDMFASLSQRAFRGEL